MNAVRFFMMLAALACIDASPAWSDELTETSASFPVTIGGNVVHLDGLVIKKSDAQGRLPIVIFTNGGETTATTGTAVTTASYAHNARDLARRGWLAVFVTRRGFGKSEGPKPTPIACQAASLNAWATAAADDLQATIDSIAQRPDADASKVVVIGSEIAGVAAVALSARNPRGLAGVIAVSGGLLSESNCPMKDILVDAYKDFGTRSRVPNLWIYSKSDKIFDPDFAERLHSAFLDGGGDVKFVMFYRDGDVGTAIFGQATRSWYTQMDGFLRTRGLPTWSAADVKEIASRLRIADSLEVPNLEAYLIENYFPAPGEKVIVFSRSAQMAWIRPKNSVVETPKLPTWIDTNSVTLDAAQKATLAGCQKLQPDCTIIMENFRWVGGTP